MNPGAVSRYVVIWRRVGAKETFRHRVAASDGLEAFLASREQVQLALGPNSEVWELENVRRLRTESAYEMMPLRTA